MSFGSLPSVLGNGGGVAISVIGGTGLFADGTAAAPSISFASTPTTGFYKDSNGFGFARNGVRSFSIGGNGALYGAHSDSQYINLPASGAIGIVAGGTAQNITLTPSGTGQVTISANALVAPSIALGGATNPLVHGISTSGNDLRLAANTSGKMTFGTAADSQLFGTFLASGRFLLGTTTDSGALLQIGTNTTTSAGGMVFGTDTFLFRSVAGTLTLNGPSQTSFSLSDAGTVKTRLENFGSDSYLSAITGSFFFRTNGGSTALTLDASQNATFAGTVKPQLATTAGAPAYVKGAIYFDTTLNKLRVGGAAAWETITSA